MNPAALLEGATKEDLAPLEAEASLLGALLFDSSIYDSLMDAVDADDFAVGAHQRIFAAIAKRRAAGETPNAALIAADLRADELLAELGGGRYLMLLANNPQGVLAALPMAKEIHMASLKRQAAAALTESAARAANGEALDVVLADTAQRIERFMPSYGGLRATPHRFPDPASIPPRQWLFGTWALRRELTVIIAPGATGKSMLVTAAALSATSGQPFLGKPLPSGPLRVWVFNLEDGTDELDRSFAAARIHYDIAPADCAGRLFTDSGRVQPLVTAEETPSGVRIVEPVYRDLKREMLANRIDLIIVDPFVDSIAVSENDNISINRVAKRWKLLAEECNCAIWLVHHSRKNGGREVSAEDSRGASSLVAAAREALVLNRMSEAEADAFGIESPEERQRLFRVDADKSNRTPPSKATWFRKESVSLGNRPDGGDNIGVATPWQPPEFLAGHNTERLNALLAKIDAGTDNGHFYQKSRRATHWVGHLIMAELDIGEAAAKNAIREWLASGTLAESTYYNAERRKDVPCLKAPEDKRLGRQK